VARLSIPRPPRLVMVLIAVDVLLAVSFTAQLLLGNETGLLAHQLHPGREANVPTWYSSTQWALAAAAFATYAMFPRPGLKGGLRLYLPVMGALLFSVDETAGFHEWLGNRMDMLLPAGTREGTIVAGTGIWMLILIPVAVVAGAWVARLLAGHLRAAPSATRLLALGAVLFVVGAGIFELANSLGSGNREMRIGIQIVEEFTEMIATTTIVWAALELLRVNRIRIGPEVEVVGGEGLEPPTSSV
jgi:hypothetical protein